MALPVPILLLPPFVLDALAATKGVGGLMARSKGARFGVELAVVAFFLQAALPFALALFPQRGAIAAGALEPEFRAKKTATGAEIET
jgi:sideroflexin-5